MWTIRFEVNQPLLYYAPECSQSRTAHALKHGNKPEVLYRLLNARFKGKPRRKSAATFVAQSSYYDGSPGCDPACRVVACDCLITFLRAIGLDRTLCLPAFLEAIGIEARQFDDEELDPFYFGLYWSDPPDFVMRHFESSDILERLKWITENLPTREQLKAMQIAWSEPTWDIFFS